MNELVFSISGAPIKAKGVPTGGLSALANIIQTALALAFLFAIIFFLFVLIWSGLNWMSSGGDKQKLQQARQRITYAIIGLAVVFLSVLIINLFGAFFGVNFLNLPGT